MIQNINKLCTGHDFDLLVHIYNYRNSLILNGIILLSTILHRLPIGRWSIHWIGRCIQLPSIFYHFCSCIEMCSETVDFRKKNKVFFTNILKQCSIYFGVCDQYQNERTPTDSKILLPLNLNDFSHQQLIFKVPSII